MSGHGFGQWFRGKRDVPHYFHDTHATMMILEILCKTGPARTHVDTQASSFYGHVTLGLGIHFSYLSQLSVFKICSFINLCIHSSPFRVFGKIFRAFTFQVHTHFFFQKLVMINESFFKEKLEVISFHKHVVF